MKKYTKYIATIVTIIWLIGLTLNIIFPNFLESLFHKFRFGATNFPTSLDALTNPASTDSVSTVSHSSQHANANDAVEALEAKVGIAASTPFTGTVMVGDGTGTSRWSTFATTTNINTTNLEVTASSTIQNITLNNATSTAATTTSLFATTASSTKTYGAGLASCTGSNFLQWTGGSYSCSSGSTGVSRFSTTTSVDMATTTITSDLIPSTNYLRIIVTASSTAAHQNRITFNNETTASFTNRFTVDGGAATAATDSYFRVFNDVSISSANIVVLDITINNFDGLYKHGNYVGFEYSTTTPSTAQLEHGAFFWKNNTGRITRIDIGNTVGSIGKNTHFDIIGY